MKLRLDLLEHLTAADILEEAAANQHRYKAEPSFSKTGIGHLSPRSRADSANEAVRSEVLTKKLTRRLQKNASELTQNLIQPFQDCQSGFGGEE
jgi:hypothetical protein